jgi:hypothetical protein
MSETNPPKPGATTFGSAKPILRVRSLAASVEHYVKVLGFEVNWHHFGVMASVSRDRCSLTSGRTRCRWKIPTDTCCASDPTPRRTASSPPGSLWREIARHLR